MPFSELRPDKLNRYLLGSGGTLVFDLTIMLQSVIYGSAPPTTTAGLPRLRNGLARRKVSYLEDGRIVSVSSERQPLLSNSIQSRAGDRSSSPREAMRGPGLTARHSGNRPPDIREDDGTA